MKKKGFTLVELIGVIIILGVIVLIATPSIRKLTKESKDELYAVQINNIKDGLKNWAIDNSKYLPKTEGDVITITLGQLKMGGYIDVEIKNPKNNKCFGNDMTLEITRHKKNYIYTVNDNTGTENTTCGDYNKPYIMLNGKAITYVEVNDSYVDEGVIARDALGNEITSSIISTITGSGSVIDTTQVGNKYTITYTIEVNGEKTSIKRTVIIRDSVAPVLAIPGNAIIDKQATNFDAMLGVSATDNSGEDVNISVKSDIAFGIPGDYFITYIATDNSGNTVTRKRSVSIFSNIFTNRIMSSDNECITSTSSVCTAGTKINVQVNATKNYGFYVLKDTGAKLTLIMDENLGDEVEWYYDEEECLLVCTNGKGPLTALHALKTRTLKWTNLEEFSYTLEDTEGRYAYSGEFVQNVRTRMPARSDFNFDFELVPDTYAYEYLCQQDDSNCPTWLNGHFWLSDLYATDSLSPDAQIFGASGNEYGDYSFVIDAYNVDYKNGLRPVIEVHK